MAFFCHIQQVVASGVVFAGNSKKLHPQKNYPMPGLKITLLGDTLSPIIMVQWKMAGYLKGNDPIGDTPIFN